jgi:arginase
MLALAAPELRLAANLLLARSGGPWHAGAPASEMLMASVHVLAVPYDSGHRAKRMGAGPLRLIEHGGALERLRAIGVAAEAFVIEAPAAFPTEIGSAFVLHRELARKVATAVEQGARPIVLSGNCNSAVGTVAGLQQRPAGPLGVVWLDGHGDCNTPETFTGTFLDAMGLSTLTGRCWQALAATVPGFEPVADERVVLVGGHGMDEGARRVLAASQIAQAPTPAALPRAFDGLRRAGVSRIYLHVDADVLDAAPARANGFAPAGGLTRGEVLACVEAAMARFPVAALTVASYDPAYDREDTVMNVALDILESVARRIP